MRSGPIVTRYHNGRKPRDRRFTDSLHAKFINFEPNPPTVTSRKRNNPTLKLSITFIFRIKKEKRNGETGANNIKNVFKIIISEHCSDWTQPMIIQRKTAVLHFASSFSRSKLPEIKKEKIKRSSKPLFI